MGSKGAIRPPGSDPGFAWAEGAPLRTSSRLGGCRDYIGAISVSTVVATAIEATVKIAEIASFSMAFPPGSIDCSASW